jgi:hypothetical protein
MKNILVLMIILSLFVASSGRAEDAPEWVKEARKDFWGKNLKEAVANDDLDICQEVETESYVAKDKKYFNKAVNICWEIAQNEPLTKGEFDYFGLEHTKENYIKLVKLRIRRKVTF